MSCIYRLAFAATLVLLSTVAVGSPLDIPNVPPETSSSVDPNIMLLLDDSGSMQFEILPDSLTELTSPATYFLFPRPTDPYGGSTYNKAYLDLDDKEDTNVTLRSSKRNALFYNPSVTYQPWRKADGSSYPTINPESASYDPAGRNNCKINLKTGDMTGSDCSKTTLSYPITFYVYVGSGDDTNRTNYIRYQYRSGVMYQWRVGTTRRECTTWWNCQNVPDEKRAPDPLPWGRSVADEVQNFANWFSYHRSRILATQAGVTRAFAELGENYRVGFCTINTCKSSSATPTVPIPHDKFTGSTKATFFDKVINVPIPAQGTPLRGALDWAGQYYKKTEDSGPWGPKVTVQGKQKQLSCRQSFTILTTDGYWDNTDNFSGAGNVDNESGSKIESSDGKKTYTYQAKAPFKDDYSNTLADVAMKYWKEDLRTDLPNDVPAASSNLDVCNANSLDPTFPDPAFWQHMTTFTLSLGVSGTLPRTPETVAKLCNGTQSWTDPTSANEKKIDDLWHAAVNGHGKFFAAQNPDEFATGLKEALGAISTLVSSASNVAVNSNRIDGNTLTFYARYYPGDWYGELLAYPVTATGIGDTPKWFTSIPAVGSRKIFTSNGSNGGISFEWSSLTAAQKTALGSQTDAVKQDIVNYLRGDQSKEMQNGGTLRSRKSLLGDIIHSSPVFVDNQQSGTARAQTVFVGANDGMLHAFDATNGQEIFAYVPNLLIGSNLATLSDPAYTHRYFVDGPIYVSNSTLTPNKQILVASLGYGGKGLFALDVTNPKSFSATNVKWEFGNDADLGLVIGDMLLTKTNDGRTAVIFGNGYNSTNEHAVLFVVDLDTGALIRKIDTGVGPSNGLSAVRGWDSNGNGTFDYIYAGDLQGNLWKFDLSNKDPSKWDVALKQGNQKQALFQAQDKNGKAQPITGRASIGLNPADGSLWVFFGTGRYLTTTDVSDTSTQSWYGIIDDGKNAVTRSQLKERKIVARGTDPTTGNPVRAFELATSGDMANEKGWYVDLDPGERIISSSQFYGSVLIASSIIPSDDPCTPGGTGYLNAIDPFTGSATGFFTDYGTVGDKKIPVGSINPRIGMLSQPVVVANPDNGGVTVLTGGSDNQPSISGNPPPINDTSGNLNIRIGRINWRELIRE
ncbi:pilus assembly protein [Tepidiphilus margaritifer]|uniref:pilus assembly protein n=1 Tax=Tepidiphilus margaritifer TaxID=203471 RepID=UPI00041C68ED|nr:PilC/PilY family type IV pilus protein [Tepidiphilus margaritifer]